MKYRRVTAADGFSPPLPLFREQARAVACDADGLWYVAGDREIRVLASDGRPLRRFSTERQPWSVAVGPGGRVWVGQSGQIEVFDAAGGLAEKWQNDENLGLVTSLAVTDDEVYAADAASRWIHRFDRARNLINHIGDHHRKGGFHIPNGILDFALAGDGDVVVANPGMHRVERYRPDGESKGHFGRFDQQNPEGFPGCCNPTNVALGPAGEVVVSEKAGPRIKAYDERGNLLAVVSREDEFDAACKNLDLAVDAQGRVGVVDTVGLGLALYAPLQSVAPSSPKETSR